MPKGRRIYTVGSEIQGLIRETEDSVVVVLKQM